MNIGQSTISLRINRMISPLKSNVFCLLLLIFTPTVLMSEKLPKIQTYNADIVIFGKAGLDGIRQPKLIQDNERLHKTVYSLENDKFIHDLSGCNWIVHSTYGKYQSILSDGTGKQCMDCFFKLSIYEAGEVVSELDWDVFYPGYLGSGSFVPLCVNEEDESIIVVSGYADSTVLSKYAISGKKIFDHSFDFGEDGSLKYQVDGNEDFIYLSDKDHIEVIDQHGHLVWTREGDFSGRIRRNPYTSSTYIYDKTSKTGFNVGDDGELIYRYSLLLSDNWVILPDDRVLTGYKVINLRDNKIEKRISNLKPNSHYLTNLYSASKNGEYFGSLSRKIKVSDSVDDYLIRVVSSANTIIADYKFDFPTPIKNPKTRELQISDDGKTVSLVYSDLGSNTYILTYEVE